jgi:hypothetical protein
VTEVPPEPPKRGSFNWLLGDIDPVVSEFHVPFPKPEPGVEQTLRVVITAKATVSPNRAWGFFIMVAVCLIVGLLAMIAANTAHGAEAGRWDGLGERPDQRDWGALQRRGEDDMRRVIDRQRRARAPVTPEQRARAAMRRQLWQTAALLGGATVIALALALT